MQRNNTISDEDLEDIRIGEQIMQKYRNRNPLGMPEFKDKQEFQQCLCDLIQTGPRGGTVEAIIDNDPTNPDIGGCFGMIVRYDDKPKSNNKLL